MQKYSILVCEDEMPLVKAIQATLEKNGFEVVTARSVTQAMGYLNNGVKIDAIWLDHYLLGKENGLDLVSRLKVSDSPWKKIPIFVVSNTASDEKVKSYVSLGVTSYFTKADYRLDQIIADIKNVITNKLP